MKTSRRGSRSTGVAQLVDWVRCLDLAILAVAGLIGCAHVEARQFYKEHAYPFLVLGDARPTSSEWIRDSENLLRVHETVRKVGYRRLVNPDAPSPLVGDKMMSRSVGEILDELVACFDAPVACTSYSSAFVRRREAQGNGRAVEVIVREGRAELRGRAVRPVDEALVIPELYELLMLTVEPMPVSDRTAERHVEVLVRLGLHQSADNILSGQRYGYPDFSWSKQRELRRRLETAESPPARVFIEDDTP